MQGIKFNEVKNGNLTIQYFEYFTREDMLHDEALLTESGVFFMEHSLWRAPLCLQVWRETK